MSCVRVLLVDDRAILRDRLRLILNTQLEPEIIGEAAVGDKVLARVQLPQHSHCF